MSSNGETVVARTGADLIAAFISQHLNPEAFLVTGGACAFIVDAIGRNPETDYVCFQHEQAAAMAADAVWRLTGKLGVTVTTSGPGATNLITGIACSWFDSIPSLHITGQVNEAESRTAIGVNARQVGFQETDIVSMVGSITKYAAKVSSIEDLANELRLAVTAATTHRMGPALLDIPMNIQKQSVSPEIWNKALAPISDSPSGPSIDWNEIDDFLSQARRPLVIIGGGTFLAGVTKIIQKWCDDREIPYVSSWSSLPHLDRSAPLYLGSQGVYGSRLANWAVQSADRILALGTRLDNRQRTGNPAAYAPFAQILVVDIDPEELGKYRSTSNYRYQLADLATWVSEAGSLKGSSQDWSAWRRSLTTHCIESGTSASVKAGELNPYDAVSELQKLFPRQSVVTADVGANLCWVYQSYGPDDSFLFTAAGNSPMGYSLPAAIGAKLVRPNSPVWCFIGDGGLQMNVQELQTIVHYGLKIIVVILNNGGYGIIKQFQDTYFEGRHEATGRGYSLPDFEKIASAYGIPYQRVNTLEEISALNVQDGPLIIDVILPEGALITPKIEMDRFLHDQFPYSNLSRDFNLPYPFPDRPSELSGISGPTV